MIKEHIIKVSGEWECPQCEGMGQWSHAILNPDGTVKGSGSYRCDKCDGTGTITEKLVTFPLWEEGEYGTCERCGKDVYLETSNVGIGYVKHGYCCGWNQTLIPKKVHRYYTPAQFAEMTGGKYDGPVWVLCNDGDSTIAWLSEWRLSEKTTDTFYAFRVAFPGQPAPPNDWRPE